MADLIASVSGLASDTATFGGAGPLADGDTLTINKGVTVTLDSNKSIGASIIGANAGSLSGLAVLDLNGHNLTLTGNLTVGNGASADGKLILGPGSTLGLGANNLVLNNAVLHSSATSGSWAFVTGTGAIITGAVYTAPKQQIELAYVSLQNTGAISFAAGGSSGGSSITNTLNVQHAVFAGCGAITFGLAGWTPSTTDRILNNNDFIDTGTIMLAGGSSASTVAQFRHNTLSRTTSGFTLVKSNLINVAFDFTGTVISGYGFDGTYTGMLNMSDVFIAHNPNGGGSGQVLAVSGSTYNGIYSYAGPELVNPHMLSFNGTSSVENCIVEMYGASGIDGGNAYIANPAAGKTTTFQHNICIGSGAAFNNVGDHAGDVFVINNTAIATSFNSYERPIDFWLSENGEVEGSLNIKNNIYVVAGGGTADHFEHDNDANAQTVAEQGYNNTYGNITTMNTGITITSDLGHNQTVDPNFVDPTRTLATWNQNRGSGTNSAADGIAYLLGINGYNPASKTQSNTPSANGVTDLVTWVSAGYVPRNAALKGAGEGGVDIGAMPVQVDSTSPVWGLGFGL